MLGAMTSRLLGTPRREVLEHMFEEQLHRLRHRVAHHATIRGVRSILVTSALEGEGKTTVAIGLARAFARSLDHWALLVETDLRRPSLAARLGLPPSPGLVGHVCEGVPLEEVIQPSGVPKLSALCAGRASLEAANVVASSQMKALAEETRARYPDRVIIIDAPPVLSTADPLALSVLVDGIVLVVRAERTPRPLVHQAARLLPAAKLLGVVLNESPPGVALPTYGAPDSYYGGGPPVALRGQPS